MSNEFLNLDPLQLFLWTTIVFLIFIIGFSLISNRKKNTNNELNSSSTELIDYKNLEPLIYSFSELNEIEKFQLSTLLKEIITEPNLIHNEKISTLNGFLENVIKDKEEKKTFVEKKQVYVKKIKVEKLIKPKSFKEKLVEKHVDLSDQELELCNYVNDGKSCSEIAVLTGLSAGSVRVYKNKLKTKMKIPKQERLSQYLASI